MSSELPPASFTAIRKFGDVPDDLSALSALNPLRRCARRLSNQKANRAGIVDGRYHEPPLLEKVIPPIFPRPKGF